MALDGHIFCLFTYSPPADLTFEGNNATIELGTSPEDYYRILSARIISPHLDEKKTYLMNITLQFNDSISIVLKNYSVPIIVIPENLTDVELINVSIPDNMTIRQNYTISAKIRNSGSNTILFLPVKLFFDAEKELLTEITEIKPEEIFVAEFNYTPVYAGFHNLTLAVSEAPNEVKLENNIYTKEVYIKPRPVRAITNINATTGMNWLNWSWDNPTDPDFSYVMLSLNGTFRTNIYAPENSYNMTGLSPNTVYELETQTVDIFGNINLTWSNQTASTLPLAAFPDMNSPPTDPDGDGIYEDINGNSRKDFNDVVLFFNNLEWVPGNEPLNAFDFNQNGRIDFADIVSLFEEI